MTARDFAFQAQKSNYHRTATSLLHDVAAQLQPAGQFHPHAV